MPRSSASTRAHADSNVYKDGPNPAGVASCAGRVWVGHGRDATWLTAIDPRSNRMRRVDVVLKAPAWPRCIRGELWVTTTDSVLQIDPRRREAPRALRARGNAGGSGGGTRRARVGHRHGAISGAPRGPGEPPPRRRVRRRAGAYALARTGGDVDHELRRLGRPPLRRILAASATARQNAARGDRRGPSPGSSRRPRRPRAEPPDRLLPAHPRDPALHLGRPSRHRRVSRGLRELARGADPGGGTGQPARLRRELHPLLDAGGRIRLPRGEPVPVVPRAAGLPGRRRDRPARPPGSLGRFLPPARRSRARARHGTRRRLGHRLVGSELGCIVERRRGGALVQRVVGRRRRSSRCLPRVVRDPRAEAPRAGCAT